MKLLILGGSGFVSGRLAQIATAQGHEVWCVTRGNRPIPEGVHALTCDAHDPAALRAALASAQLQWDAALDCICRDAASASVDLSVLPAFTNRLLVISTDSVYHPAYKRVPQDETGVYLHDGGYGSSKRQMEEVFLDAAAHSESPFAWTIFRPGHIFGAGSQVGCFPEHSRQPDLIARMKRGEPLRLVGGGKFLIHPIYVDDLCRVLLESIPVSTAFNEIFCIGGPDIVSNAAYYILLGEILNVPVSIEEIPLAGYLEAHPQFSGHLCHRAYSLEKLRRTGIALPGTPPARRAAEAGRMAPFSCAVKPRIGECLLRHSPIQA